MSYSIWWFATPCSNRQVQSVSQSVKLYVFFLTWLAAHWLSTVCTAWSAHQQTEGEREIYLVRWLIPHVPDNESTAGHSPIPAVPQPPWSFPPILHHTASVRQHTYSNNLHTTYTRVGRGGQQLELSLLLSRLRHFKWQNLYFLSLTCSLDGSMLHFCRLQLVRTNATLRERYAEKLTKILLPNIIQYIYACIYMYKHEAE